MTASAAGPADEVCSPQVSVLRDRIEAVLDNALPLATQVPERLHAAQRYAVLGGGKRLRPLFVYATGQALGVPLHELDAPAAAVELIHAYSLIHDDLPAMDDDDMRRGRPTTHRAFDEATAILAGDALQVLAFALLAADTPAQASCEARMRMVQILAEASGTAGMAGGQALDLAAVGHALSLDELAHMHRLKTGALLRASVMMAAAARPGLTRDARDALDLYAQHVGLAFQIRDDVLDVEGESARLGKTAGADAVRNKPTYASILGLSGAKERALESKQLALAALVSLPGDVALLQWLAWYAVERVV